MRQFFRKKLWSFHYFDSETEWSMIGCTVFCRPKFEISYVKFWSDKRKKEHEEHDITTDFTRETQISSKVQKKLFAWPFVCFDLNERYITLYTLLPSANALYRTFIRSIVSCSWPQWHECRSIEGHFNESGRKCVDFIIIANKKKRLAWCEGKKHAK